MLFFLKNMVTTHTLHLQPPYVVAPLHTYVFRFTHFYSPIIDCSDCDALCESNEHSGVIELPFFTSYVSHPRGLTHLTNKIMHL